MENKQRVNFSPLLNKILGLDKPHSKEELIKIVKELRKNGNEKIEPKKE